MSCRNINNVIHDVWEVMVQYLIWSVYVSSRVHVFEIDSTHVVPQHHLARHVAQKLRYRSRHYVVYVETRHLQWQFQMPPQKHIKYRYHNATHAIHHVIYVTPWHQQWLFQILALKHIKYRYHNASHVMYITLFILRHDMCRDYLKYSHKNISNIGITRHV